MFKFFQFIAILFSTLISTNAQNGCDSIEPTIENCRSCAKILASNESACVDVCPKVEGKPEESEWDNNGICQLQRYRMTMECVRFGPSFDYWEEGKSISSAIAMEEAFAKAKADGLHCDLDSDNDPNLDKLAKNGLVDWQHRVYCPGNIGSQFMCNVTATFYVPKVTNWRLGFGFDGNAALLKMDGIAVNFAKQEWWWQRKPELFWKNDIGNLIEGEHTMQLFMYEYCCDGPQRYTFGVNTNLVAEYQTFTIANLKQLDNLDVDINPIPCTYFQTCDDCVNSKERPDCVWCDAEGGSCYERNSATCAGTAYDPTSQVIFESRENNSNNYYPSFQKVILRNGIRIKVPLTVTQEIDRETQLYVLVDNTDTMAALSDDLTKIQNLINDKANFGNIICNTQGTLDANCMTFKDGYGGFKPFNYIDDALDTTPNYLYKEGSKTFTDTLSLTNGGDTQKSNEPTERVPSDILEALLQAIQCRPDEWDSSKRHIILIVTNTIANLQYTHSSPKNVDFSDEESDYREGTRGRYQIIDRSPGQCYFDAADDDATRDSKITAATVQYDTPGSGQIKKALLELNAAAAVVHGSSLSNFWGQFVDSGLGLSDNFVKGGLNLPDSPPESIEELTLSAVKNVYDYFRDRIEIVPTDSTGRLLFAHSWSNPFDNAVPGVAYNVFVALYSSGYENVDLSSDDLAENPALSVNVVGLGEAKIQIIAASCECTKNKVELKLGDTTVGEETCGRTTCEEDYFGVGCLCTKETINEDCSALNDCNGQGLCVCGKCQCFDGFENAVDGTEDCSCPTSDDACPSVDGVPCNGQGTCECGGCNCNADYTVAGKIACECKVSPVDTCVENSANCLNGICQEANGCGEFCVCDFGFTGEFCDCAICDTTCGEDGGTGSCNCGTCDCVGDYDPNASPPCSCLIGVECPSVEGQPCNGQGTCECGVCNCNPIYTGDDCSCPVGGTCGGDCGFGTCECDVCVCQDGYIGENCDCLANTTCVTDDNGNECSGHGSCVIEKDACGVCLCEPGYSLDDCSCLSRDCPTENGIQCSNQGSCEGDCGICNCNNEGIIGLRCQCDTNAPENQCPLGDNGESCSGHGTCIYNENTCGECLCDNPTNSDSEAIWTGDDCSCNNNLCPSVGGLVCGENSEFKCEPCSSTCLCTNNYTQPTNTTGCICSNLPCPEAGGQVCNGHGTCEPCGCECTEGWAGTDCTRCPMGNNVTSIRNSGEYCNLELVVEDNTDCSESACLNCSQFDGNCEDCQARAPDHCAWCSGFCFTLEEFPRLCDGPINEPCSQNDAVPVAAYVGAAVGVLFLILLALLLYKGIITYLDHREWAEFNKGSKKANIRTNQNLLFRANQTSNENPLSNI